MDLSERSREMYDAGRAAMESGDLDSATDFFDRSLKASPHFKTAELLGECLLRRGRLEEAAVYLASAVGLGNKAYRAAFLLAKALSQAGDKTGAFEQAQKALEMNPSYRSARELLAELEQDPEVQAALARERV